MMLCLMFLLLAPYRSWLSSSLIKGCSYMSFQSILFVGSTVRHLFMKSFAFYEIYLPLKLGLKFFIFFSKSKSVLAMYGYFPYRH